MTEEILSDSYQIFIAIEPDGKICKTPRFANNVATREEADHILSVLKKRGYPGVFWLNRSRKMYGQSGKCTWARDFILGSLVSSDSLKSSEEI